MRGYPSEFISKCFDWHLNISGWTQMDGPADMNRSVLISHRSTMYEQIPRAQSGDRGE